MDISRFVQSEPEDILCVCRSCGRDFFVSPLDQQAIEMEQERTKEIFAAEIRERRLLMCEYLENHREHEYLDLEQDWLAVIESEYETLINQEPSRWGDCERLLIKLLTAFKGRAALEEAKWKCSIELLLRQIVGQQQVLIQYLGGSAEFQSSQILNSRENRNSNASLSALKSINASTSLLGLEASKRLGKEFGEMFSDE